MAEIGRRLVGERLDVLAPILSPLRRALQLQQHVRHGEVIGHSPRSFSGLASGRVLPTSRTVRFSSTGRVMVTRSPGAPSALAAKRELTPRVTARTDKAKLNFMTTVVSRVGLAVGFDFVPGLRDGKLMLISSARPCSPRVGATLLPGVAAKCVPGLSLKAARWSMLSRRRVGAVELTRYVAFFTVPYRKFVCKDGTEGAKADRLRVK